MNLVNLTNQTFGRLTVLCQVGHEGGRVSWYCKCSCGGFKIIDSKALRTGKTASCGCLRGTHKRSKTDPLYRVWTSMRERCNNPKTKAYKRYGARGIKVCARWDDFEMFIKDMGPRPVGHSIERNNNDGDYEPGNCRWATDLEQAQNTSRTRRITAGGQTKTITKWAKSVGGSTSIIHNRLKQGWSEEAACLTPTR